MLGLPVCATWLKCTLGHGSPISKSGNHSHPSVIPLNETVLHFEWSAKSVHKSCNRLGAFPQTNTWQSRNPFGILPTSQFRISSEYVFKGSDFSHSVILTSNCQSLCVDRLCVYTPKCMHVCVCMLPLACYVYTYVCAHMYTCLHVYAYTCLCIYIPAHVCSMYVGTRVYMAICGYTCICVYAHACMYKCIAAGTGMMRSAHQYFHPITEQKPTQCKKKRMNSHENHLFMYPEKSWESPSCPHVASQSFHRASFPSQYLYNWSQTRLLGFPVNQGWVVHGSSCRLTYPGPPSCFTEISSPHFTPVRSSSVSSHLLLGLSFHQRRKLLKSF